MGFEGIGAVPGFGTEAVEGVDDNSSGGGRKGPSRASRCFAVSSWPWPARRYASVSLTATMMSWFVGSGLSDDLS